MDFFDGYPVKEGFKGDGWELENCKLTHEANPESFEIPSSDEASLVKIGDLLRLHFTLTGPFEKGVPRAERMWVEVCMIQEDCFYGHLTNEPIAIDSLTPGDVIQFNWNHVAQIYIRAGDPRHSENA